MEIERPTEDLAGLKGFLKNHLLELVMPFWERYAVDPAGGLNTCIRDDGALVSRDKWLWSQWRAVWVYSTLYDRIERNDRWLEIADSIRAFSAKHGWNDEVGGWNLRLSGDGEVLDGPKSIYADGFAIYGLTAFARATGSDEAAALAVKTADNVLRRLAAPHDTIPAWPYPTPEGARIHGLPMMFSLIMWELGRYLGEERYLAASRAMSDDVFENFHRRDRDVVLERIAEDGGEYPAPLGTAIVPGHAIEDMWFQIHIAREDCNNERIATACHIIDRHMALGWDDEYGGILLAVDADGREEVGWKFADTKLWWPHTEALYATLLAYERTRDKRFLEWYDRVHEYAFSRFPVPEHGEWTQKLNRRGKPITEVVALPVKDPFHLPRALIYCVDVLGRLAPSGA